jgi:ATP-dependent DNA ligase
MITGDSSVRADGPTLVREPIHRDGWMYEGKVDGWRILAYEDDDPVRLVSRHGVDHTKRSARVRHLVEATAATGGRAAC